MSDANIVTYQSQNAHQRRQWIAFIEVEGAYLTAFFQGETEQAAHDAASAEWEKHRAVREANIAAREEGRRKAAETKAKKKAEAS